MRRSVLTVITLSMILAAARTTGLAGEAPDAAKPVVLDRIAAVVNDEVITLSEVDGQIPPAGLSPEERVKARREALDRLIEAALITQEATRTNVTVSDQEIETEIASVREREKLTQEDLVKALAAEGLTFQEYRTRLADNIRRAKVIGRLVRGSLTVPDARLKAYYEANKARFTPPASLRLRLLLIPFSPAPTDAERAVARAEAQALRLRAINGEPFEALVKAYSRGPVVEEGGDLGVMKAGELDPRFEEAVRGLAPGQISTPVMLDGGVALLELVQREGGEPQPFEKVRDRIYRTLYDQEFEKAVGQWVKDLRAKAHVEVKL